MRLVIWGAGELGGRVGAAWARGGEPVLGLTQSCKRHAWLRARGIIPQLGSAAGLLAPSDAFLLALPGSARQLAAVVALGTTLPPERAVLISSIGYYGTPQGRVDEDTPPGNDAHAAAVVAAELAFRTWSGTRGVVLRLGGLYCHGRGPLAALLRRGTAPPGPPDRTLALIHYEDAATAALAALRHPSPEPTYVGVTLPSPMRQEFYQHACRTAGLPTPTFAPPLSLLPVEYDITRLRRDLLPLPAYPDWRAAVQQAPHPSSGAPGPSG
jgi:nucleoside-diphosphate-sugar epimerase